MQYIKFVQQFFRPQHLISDESADWIIDCFKWALLHFDRDEFFSRTILIQPNNECFPGDVSSVEEKAQNIFKHSLKYAGLEHWSFQLKHSNFSYKVNYPQQQEAIQRNSHSSSLLPNNKVLVEVAYNRQLTLKPEGLASHFSQIFAQHLILQSGKTPPGGFEYAVEASEVLAVFMGFGVLLSNTAYSFRGGCGSCYNPSAERQASLSESEIVFSLAVFCYLKNIDTQSVLKGLKKHLRPSFKIAKRQVANILTTKDILSLPYHQKANI